MHQVGCYVRVSTHSQNEAGQRDGIRAWLDGNGISADATRWYVDVETGDKLERSALRRLQREVFDGQVKTVVVWRLDRLSRKLRDGLNIICDWCERGLRVVSVTQQIDFSGTAGQMIAAVLLGVAQMEQEARRERQKAGITAARSRGVYKGRKVGTTKANPTRARQLHSAGLRHEEIAQALGVHRNTIARYLKVTPTSDD